MSRELLVRHRPALCFDAQEPYRAMSAASMTDCPGNVLLLEDGSVLARAGEGLSLSLLSAYPAQAGDRLDQVPDALAAAQRFQADPAYASRCYGRAVDDGDRTWLQYWLWYLYNPKHLLGFGRHEGDWELVQVALGNDGEPLCVTCSQHESGEARDWDRVEKLDGLHPVVYVAPFSHANYFEAGAHPYLIGNDEPDGSQLPELPEQVEELGEWKSWPGRWGNSRGVSFPGIKPGKLGGRSPASPARQGTRWSHPARYHAEAQRQTPWRKLGRIVRRLGALTYPKLCALSAELHGAVLTLRYEIERPADSLYVTVHAGERTLLSRVLAVSSGRGEAQLTLPEPLGECVVRASAYNRVRQRSDPLEAVARQAPHGFSRAGSAVAHPAVARP